MQLKSKPYERPVVRMAKTPDLLFDLLIPKRLEAQENLDWRIKKLKDFLESPSGGVRWNLDDVCGQLELAMSGRHARRLFAATAGIGVREYAKNRRLAKAAEQLHSTNTPVKAIAADAGYQSTCHFARSFRVLFQLRPLEFRKLCQRIKAAA